MSKPHFGLTPLLLASCLGALAALTPAAASALVHTPCPNGSQKDITITGYTASPYPARLCSNIAYGPNNSATIGSTQRLDIYRPTSDLPNGGTFPVLVWIHGGGWNYYDRVFDRNNDANISLSEDYQGILRQVTRGFTVVSVDYRLITYEPSIHFPEPLYDVKQAVRWIKANAGAWKLNSAQIAAGGHSAGAHLASLMGGTAEAGYFEPPDANMPSPYDGLRTQSSKTSLTIGFAGVYNFTRDLSNIITQGAVATFLGCDVPGIDFYHTQCSYFWRVVASPQTYTVGPPVFLLHSPGDSVVDYQQTLDYKAALDNAGRPVTLRTLATEANHGDVTGDLHFWNFCRSDDCLQLQMDLLLYYFANGPAPWTPYSYTIPFPPN
jgi:acetyl esterase/lipase